MPSPIPTIDVDLEEVRRALAAVEPPSKWLLLFGSRARGEARPDSDIDLLAVMPDATLTPLERQQALRSLRAALLPLPLRVAVDLVWWDTRTPNGCLAPAGIWWRAPCARGRSCMSPVEDAAPSLRLAQAKLLSLVMISPVQSSPVQSSPVQSRTGLDWIKSF